MTIRKISLFVIARGLSTFHVKQQFLNPTKNQITVLSLCRFLSHHPITKSIDIYTQENQKNAASQSNGEIGTFRNEQNRPLLVLLAWLMAKRNHTEKYISLYMEQGFDVVAVNVTPWQFLWPMKGSQLVVRDLLKFLADNQKYEQIILHGFSVGGYLWGEVMNVVQQNHDKYDNVINRVVGQIWDSAADLSEISIGVPAAVFPNSPVPRKMLKAYMKYHMSTFHEQSTQHYIRSSQLFFSTMTRCPALFFMSKTDPVGPIKSNVAVRDAWDSAGIQTYVKIFEKSPHVGHFRKYPKDYVAELYAFLNKLNLIQDEEKIRARL